MKAIPKRVRMGALGAFAALAVFLPASGASAANPVTLNGEWAPFVLCPVDNPAMLAADGTSNIAFCLASMSSNGAIKFGNITAPTNQSQLHIGLVYNTSTGVVSEYPPSVGANKIDPFLIPGGLAALLCPRDIGVARAVCEKTTNSQMSTVMAVPSPAGSPYGFNFTNAQGSGKPIQYLLMKIQLQNPLLGPDCYIGSDSNPIVLQPYNVTTPVLTDSRFDGNGTPDATNGVMTVRTENPGGTREADTFTLPAVTGCGPHGILDRAIDHNVGLPSASGSNYWIWYNEPQWVAFLTNPAGSAPNDGKDLSAYWHSAVQP